MADKFVRGAAVLYVCPETGEKLVGKVKESAPWGADLTVCDPRYKEPATKIGIPFDADGKTPGSFHFPPPPEPVPAEVVKTEELAKDAAGT